MLFIFLFPLAAGTPLIYGILKGVLLQMPVIIGGVDRQQQTVKAKKN